MSVVINTNSAATMAADNLATSSGSLQKSLNRLSSGSRIVNPDDDAGGLAVSMKLSATAHRQAAVANNIGNSTSFLQSQDGVLNVVGKVLTRMSELKTLYLDPTKNSSDLANYNSEFTQLQTQLTSLGNEKFNGISLFGSSGLNVGVTADATAGTTVNVGAAALMGGGSTSLLSDNFSNLNNWNTLVGATVSGNALTLTGGGAGVTSNQSFSGAFDMTYNVQLSATNSAMVLFYHGQNIANLAQGGAITDTAVHSVRVSFDGTGNASTYLDGSGSALSTVSGVATTSGSLIFDTNGNANPAQLSNLSVTTPGAPSNVSTVATSSSLGSVSLSTISAALQDVATIRANNGASQSRLGFAADVLTTNKANIEAANSRITDVDVAQESTQLARYNVLVQSGTAMLSQANQSSQIALKLLG